jgi:hypothetical protein
MEVKGRHHGVHGGDIQVTLLFIPSNNQFDNVIIKLVAGSWKLEAP